MKVRVTFKTPDAVGDAIREALDRLESPEGIDGDEWASVLETWRATLEARAGDWFTWLEYVTVEWNTDTNLATVVKP